MVGNTIYLALVSTFFRFGIGIFGFRVGKIRYSLKCVLTISLFGFFGVGNKGVGLCLVFWSLARKCFGFRIGKNGFGLHLHYISSSFAKFSLHTKIQLPKLPKKNNSERMVATQVM